ncbi:acyl-CoA dehydrogenase family protein [Pseudonocardia sp. NPDC046786]|uniref:acyl-CoA dehydrogenase family protein n=1 Tax=Pseudonocardia sp. NPDC046786 TaxID=3155471 RepID=UPI00340C4A76
MSLELIHGRWAGRIPSPLRDVVVDVAQELAAGRRRRDEQGTASADDLGLIDRPALLGATLPAEHDGEALPTAALVEVFATLAAADPAVTQLLLPHFVQVRVILGLGGPELVTQVVEEIRAGGRLSAGASERGTPRAWVPATRLRPGDPPTLSGRKYYATGALTARRLGITALDADDRLVLAVVPADAAGLVLEADWDSFGQRATASGSVVLTDVRVDPANVLPLWKGGDTPGVEGAFDQLLHAAIDQGIARAALTATRDYLRDHARVWFESEAERIVDEPEVVARFGEIAARVIAADGALAAAARRWDEVVAEDVTADSAATLSIEVAAAKDATTRVAIETANSLFELGGASATASGHGLDWYWRNARTHTLHDPIRWKHRHIGNYALHDTRPPRHGLI